MMIRFFKHNSILLAFFGLYLIVLGLVLIEIDKQYYQNDKRRLIQDANDFYIDQGVGPELLAELEHWAGQYLQSRQPNAREELVSRIWQVLEGKNIVYRIKIRVGSEETSPEGGLERERENFIIDLPPEEFAREKLAANNTFSNSLFLRNFSGTVAKPIVNPQQELLGRLVVYYTTPPDDPLIRELTRRYYWYVAFIVLVLTVLTGALARSLLVPLRNVMSALESSRPARTEFVEDPRSRLESLYNRMALDAVIARLQGQLREEIARRPQMTGWEVVEFVCQSFAEQISAPLTGCLELVAEGPGRIRATGQRVFAGSARGSVDEAELARRIDDAMPRDSRTEAGLTVGTGSRSLELELQLMSDPERTGIRYLFALGLLARDSDNAGATLQTMLARLGETVEAGLQTLSLRNQLLVQERGRANISLSRNLGHDLTNIIATSKLELMALERLLGDGVLPEDTRRKLILGESLHGLLRSVKFMQETVNLYRAYAFLQHPVLEVQDGNQLIAETLELFSMSISAKIELKEVFAGDAPRAVVDPRLIKLALFNLFTNALEAIRKTDPEHTAHGWIRVVTRRTTEGGLCVAIEDSGTGILMPDGRRAEAHEIEKIFELGYTTHRISGSQGEGLGLNWVRTIVQDLHGGAIFAENLPAGEGGARFVVIFPPLEQSGELISTPGSRRDRVAAPVSNGDGEPAPEFGQGF